MRFIKKYWWALALVVVLIYWQRVTIGTAIYSMTGGKISLFGVKGGSI
jgi:hypothetical protein